MKRPRVLLVPNLTELEWLIKPQLEEWAEVASFDLPGVGNEPPPEKWDREEAVQRTLRELERRGWNACFLAADAHGIPTAVRAAAAWHGDVLGLALGHARLSDRSQGERAPVNRAVWEAMGQLIKNDYSAFVRAGLTQLTQGSIADELAKQLLERVPMNIAQAAYENIMSETESIEGLLRELDVPLLFAKHEGCIASTEEGWEDAVAAFQRQRRSRCRSTRRLARSLPRRCDRSVRRSRPARPRSLGGSEVNARRRFLKRDARDSRAA